MRWLLILATVGACASDRAQITDTLARYDHMVKAMDGAGIAALFVPDGSIANDDQTIAHGRDAIRTFLASFVGKVEVVDTGTDVSTVNITGDHARVTGTFHQTARLLPDGKVLQPHGDFDADFVRTPAGWRIERMHTTPK